MSILTVSIEDVKALAGISGTTEDDRIQRLIELLQPGYEGIISLDYLGRESLQPELTLGVAYLIAQEAITTAGAPGPAVEQKAGDASIKFSERIVAGGGSLREKGMELLKPYLKHNANFMLADADAELRTPEFSPEFDH